MKTITGTGIALIGGLLLSGAMACASGQKRVAVVRTKTMTTSTTVPAPVDPDPDGDGILGDADKCPKKAELVNGFQDEDGCPDVKPRVLVKLKTVEITEHVQFANNSAEIKPESASLINEIATVLKNHPEVQLVEVVGHASKVGKAKYNLKLTQQRVESVVAGLVNRGVAKDRLNPQGLGFYCPLPNATTEAENRRVEFNILYRNGKALDVERACPAAINAGVELSKLLPIPAPAPAKPAGS